MTEKVITEEELEVLAQSVYDNSINIIRHAYVDIAGDLVAGALLGQILYWFEPDKKTGKSRARIQKDGHLWLAKQRTDWWDEIRITDRQYDRAAKVLVEKELIFVKNYMFNGKKLPHIRPNYEKIHEEIEKWKGKVKQLILEGGKPVLRKVSNREKSTVSDDESGGVKTGLTESVKPESPNEENRFDGKCKTDFTQSVKPISPDEENRNDGKGKTGFDESGKPITETTSETTPELTSEGTSENTSEDTYTDLPHQEEKPGVGEEDIFLAQQTLYDNFRVFVSADDVKRILSECHEKGKEFADCVKVVFDIHQTKPRNDIVAALLHEIRVGHHKPVKPAEKLPKAVVKPLEQPKKSEKELAEQKARIQEKLKLMNAKIQANG